MDAGNGNSWMLVIGLGSLLLNFAVTIGGGVWALGRNNDKIVEKFDQKIMEMERRFEDAVDRTTHDFGESISAIRQHVNSVELWNRDNFVNKNTFQLIVTEIKESGIRLENKIDDRFKEINVKLDALREA